MLIDPRTVINMLRTRVLPILILAAVALGAGACSSDDDKEAKSPTTLKRGAGATAPTTAPIVTVDEGPKDAILPSEAKEVEEIDAEGYCKDALEEVRDLMDEYASGLALDDDGNEKLTKDLAAVDFECPVDIATNFRSVEMANWLNAAVPVEAGKDHANKAAAEAATTTAGPTTTLAE